MIEIELKKHLESILKIPVIFEEDLTHDSFVVIEKIGSRKENHLESSRFSFQSYAKSMLETALLNNKVKNAVESFIESDNVAKVSLQSDYNFTDPRVKRYRYQAIFEIYHY